MLDTKLTLLSVGAVVYGSRENIDKLLRAVKYEAHIEIETLDGYTAVAVEDDNPRCVFIAEPIMDYLHAISQRLSEINSPLTFTDCIFTDLPKATRDKLQRVPELEKENQRLREQVENLTRISEARGAQLTDIINILSST